MTDRVTALRAELEPIVTSLQLSIYDITLTGGERPTLAVMVDRPGGIDLDAIEIMTGNHIAGTRYGSANAHSGRHHDRRGRGSRPEHERRGEIKNE